MLITFSGNARISPDGQDLLIDNLWNGMDAYSIHSRKHIATFNAPVAERKPKQVMFDPSGDFVIQGSDKGLVYISDFHTLAPVQALVHSKHRGLVQAVTVRFLPSFLRDTLTLHLTSVTHITISVGLPVGAL
ncbi:hypothetical protein K439DRAFT_1421544 [Ramaria rubella]|nr:hypothetical protein K439DRAFT_1421544 [Ramaria rubella]